MGSDVEPDVESDVDSTISTESTSAEYRSLMWIPLYPLILILPQTLLSWRGDHWGFPWRPVPEVSDRNCFWELDMRVISKSIYRLYIFLLIFLRIFLMIFLMIFLRIFLMIFLRMFLRIFLRAFLRILLTSTADQHQICLRKKISPEIKKLKDKRKKRNRTPTHLFLAGRRFLECSHWAQWLHSKKCLSQ